MPSSAAKSSGTISVSIFVLDRRGYGDHHLSFCGRVSVKTVLRCTKFALVYSDNPNNDNKAGCPLAVAPFVSDVVASGLLPLYWLASRNLLMGIGVPDSGIRLNN